MGSKPSPTSGRVSMEILRGGALSKMKLTKVCATGPSLQYETKKSSPVRCDNCTTTSSAQWSRSDSCREYARDYSMRYSRDGFMGGVVRGALGGAVIGGIAGGGRGAGRGAGAGALLGGATRGIQSSTLFDRAYSRCMRGRWP